MNILEKLSTINNLKLIIFIIIINKKFIDAIDWTKKYFKEDSVDNKLLEREIIGINLNKLISNPIQQPKKLLEEIAIKVLKNKIK